MVIVCCADVQKSLVWMEKVIGFYHVGDEVEVKIREGPSGDIGAYLNLLNHLKEAMDHFNQFNSESLELVHLSELFDVGMEALIREFRQLLQKHSKPVHVATLHDIAMCEEAEGKEGEVPSQHFSSHLADFFRHASSDITASQDGE